MNSEIQSPVNIQLIESLVQAIRSLSPAEQHLLDQKLYSNIPEPSTLPSNANSLSLQWDNSTQVLENSI